MPIDLGGLHGGKGISLIDGSLRVEALLSITMDKREQGRGDAENWEKYGEGKPRGSGNSGRNSASHRQTPTSWRPKMSPGSAGDGPITAIFRHLG